MRMWPAQGHSRPGRPHNVRACFRDCWPIRLHASPTRPRRQVTTSGPGSTGDLTLIAESRSPQRLLRLVAVPRARVGILRHIRALLVRILLVRALLVGILLLVRILLLLACPTLAFGNLD